MKKNEISDCAGNLYEEMEEIKKFISDENSTIPYSTSTRSCAAFLTIYCC